MVSTTKMSLILFFASSLFLQGILGELICESLPSNLCSFAIASSGKRCVLENYRNDDGSVEYTCKTSEVVVERLSGYIETDQCVKACGVDRGFVGISSDAFLTAEFTSNLCSPSCYQNCPNIVDLYFNLAAGEGVFLPALCEKQKANPHRAMLEILSNGGPTGGGAAAAPGPMAADYVVDAPAPAPAFF
ncbi:PAR1 protein [Perilla frutescens var. hirtella]|uniref:PAR1 protein n=1 Tax=Perilla frutescens var. hirtella TaxID=608512 RepID=A0AAD4J9C4_PERFH|nr:PAR1 protein [Perilla frutescens var. hirtella]